MERYDLEFRDLLMRNKQRIYYQLHRLNINDTHQEFYQEGLVAMWNAYRTYKADKGPFATYFNYTIRYRMIDLLRHENCYERLPPRKVRSEERRVGKEWRCRRGVAAYKKENMMCS